MDGDVGIDGAVWGVYKDDDSKVMTMAAEALSPIGDKAFGLSLRIESAGEENEFGGVWGHNSCKEIMIWERLFGKDQRSRH